MNKLITIRGLSVSYDGFEALSGVSLDIFADDFLGIIGPNGGGKTTLIKAILGLVDYSGSIDYDDSLRAVRGHSIGYLPQQNNFDRSFPISILELVMSGLQSEVGFKRYNKEDGIRAGELLEMTGIADCRHKTPGEVSGGQLQRALLCRALISDPRVLILDEPANFVDNRFEKELYQILRSLNDRMAILMVSHDVGTITSVVKNIVCVNKHVHRHGSNRITPEQLANYNCPIQLVYHGEVPHVVLDQH